MLLWLEGDRAVTAQNATVRLCDGADGRAIVSASGPERVVLVTARLPGRRRDLVCATIMNG